MTMRFRRPAKPIDNPPQEKQASSNTFEPSETRQVLFTILENRFGSLQAKLMRADFDDHIAADPVHGVEMAYICITSKLVGVIDTLNDVTALMPSFAPDIPPVNPFGLYRKDG